ncbi:unnamed protein product [Arctia plantaginis]|uniref:Uncharacterized protein n=1 Tax=Arctia plantaginis TaxID=874455 RepID=A0A8S0ZCI3_ARCPL|nr:unnamed protein product [Arctia plantaginis]
MSLSWRGEMRPTVEPSAALRFLGHPPQVKMPTGQIFGKLKRKVRKEKDIAYTDGSGSVRMHVKHDEHVRLWRPDALELTDSNSLLPGIPRPLAGIQNV